MVDPIRMDTQVVDTEIYHDVRLITLTYTKPIFTFGILIYNYFCAGCS